MNFPCIYPIVNFDSRFNPQNHIECLLNAGAEILQLRGKNIGKDDFITIAKETLIARNQISPHTKIIINDSIEIAKEVNADGVHLGQEDSKPKIARDILGQSAIIGLSTHNLTEVMQAPVELLNYLAIGPIFSSITKSGHAPEVGLKTLAQVKTKLPLVAIGGINLANASGVYKAGADCIASVSDFEKNTDLKKLIESYKATKKEIIS